MKLYGWIIAIFVLLALAGIILSVSSRPSSTGNAAGGTTGSAAPDFTLPSTAGGDVSLSDYRGEYNVLLYFQEGVMCPPCWTQMVDFERQISKFDAKGIKILTITTDRLYQSQSYARQAGTGLPVLADEDKKVSRMYDALKDSMHPGEKPGHLFVLVDKDGDIAWRYSAYTRGGSGNDHHSNGSGRMYVPVGEVLDSIGRSL